MKRRHLVALLPLSGVALGKSALAETFPAKPLRIIATSPPGGVTDVLARLLAEGLQTSLGQRVIVENKPGAGGTIGAYAAARASADGYTLFLGLVSTQVIQPAVRTLPFDADTAFAPIGLVSLSPLVLAINPSVPAQSLKELVALSRTREGSLNFSIAGTATLPHLLYEMLVRDSGLSAEAVVYNGSAPSLQAVINGEVAATVEGTLLVRNQVLAGKLRALAVTSASRDPALPDVPTMIELGFPQFEVTAWSGLFAPAGTPAAHIDALNKALNALAETEEFRNRLTGIGAVPKPGRPQALEDLIASEKQRWSSVLAKLASSLK